MSNSSKQIKLGAIMSYFTIAFNMVAGLIYTPWMIEQIGRNDYGLYTLANSVISMFLADVRILTVHTQRLYRSLSSSYLTVNVLRLTVTANRAVTSHISKTLLKQISRLVLLPTRRRAKPSTSLTAAENI